MKLGDPQTKSQLFVIIISLDLFMLRKHKKDNAMCEVSGVDCYTSVRTSHNSTYSEELMCHFTEQASKF